MSFGINALTIKDRNSILLLIIGGIILLNIIPMPVLSPIMILLLGLMAGILIIFIFVPEDFNFLLKIFLIGFSIRAFLSFLFYILSFVFENKYRSTGFFFPNDGWLYSEQGWQIYRFAERGIRISMADYLTNPNMPISSGNITAYDYFTSFIYSITGHSPLSLFFINSVTGSLAALFIYLIAKELFSKNVARIGSLFAFFWPSFIMWSTQNLKEPMIAMLGCILIWTVLYMHRHLSYGLLLLSFGSVLALFKIGAPYIVIIIGMIFFTGAVLFSKYLFKNRFVVMVIIGLLAFIFFPFIKAKIIAFISEKTAYGGIKNYRSILEFFDYNRMVRSGGRLQFLKNVKVSNFGNAIAFIPLGLMYAIFAPFPWQLGSAMQIMAVPETVVFYIVFPFTLKGIFFAYKKRFNQSILLLSIITAMMIFLALIEGNSGTLFRHRFLAFNLLFIFTAIGITLRKAKRNEG